MERTVHPDNMAAGPASYGMTDTMGRMHSDAQLTSLSSFSLGKINKFPLRSLGRRFAGSSSVKPKVFPPSRSAKQASFFCARSCVGSGTRGDDELPRHRTSNAQASE